MKRCGSFIPVSKLILFLTFEPKMNGCRIFIPISKLILFLTFELKVSNVSPNPETCPKFEKVWAAKFADGALHKIVTVHSCNTHHTSVRSTCFGIGLPSSLFIWTMCVFVFLYYCTALPWVIFLPSVFLWLLFLFLFCIVCIIVVVVVYVLNNQTASV